MRAVLYARYSSDQQREASLEDQLRLCRERITAEGWHLVQVFQDRALSGATSLRPAYQALLASAREGAFDVLVSEALDRLSRDQEDVAALFKRMRFAGVRIVTLAEGEISELHIGLKGTMNALFLKDLAAKTHRGLRGRVEAGRSGGGNAYGYRVVRKLGSDGRPVVGEREIDGDQARVVERIFLAYSAGRSPRATALALNAEQILAPRGSAWTSSTIDGNRVRGTGILNNELYVGRLVWNRLTYIKDPDTGKRRSRARAADEKVAVEVPDLRIIDQALWDAVKIRQAALDRQQTATMREDPAPFWSKQRPRYLFSGLMRCGVCGGGYSKNAAATFACSTARNKGPTACANRLSIRRDVVEQTVLDGLAHRLMDPELFKVFMVEFTTEWNRLQAEVSSEHAALEGELDRIRRQIERLVDAIVNGAPAASVNGRLHELERRRTTVEAQLASSAAPAPRLHPNLAEFYRQKMAQLAETLARDDSAEARELVRGLVDAVVLTPEDGRLQVEVRGALAAILSLAQGVRDKAADQEVNGLASQIKLVAGTGFEPVTFRL